MNTEQPLDRIIALARRAPARATTIPAYGLETVVLAHWREANTHCAADGMLLGGLRWAALAALAVALLTAVLKNDELTAFSHRSDLVTRVADSAIAAGYGYE